MRRPAFPCEGGCAFFPFCGLTVLNLFLSEVLLEFFRFSHGRAGFNIPFTPRRVEDANRLQHPLWVQERGSFPFGFLRRFGVRLALTPGSRCAGGDRAATPGHRTFLV